MTYNSDISVIKIKNYTCTSTNQHGDRYKHSSSNPLNVLRLEVGYKDKYSDGLVNLIAIGNALNVPVRYDFKEPQKAYIEIVSAEQLRGLLS